MPRKPQKGAGSAAGAAVRCAIYTRKSTEEGLEQPFNSLDAQREAAEAYIASQRHQGWIALPDRYDDGGYSGGHMQRPALQRLLADIAAGTIDALVVYKVDRLSRSLLDFARIMAVLEQRGTSFVSITQQFNTTASIGRLTLHILLSFAEFERSLVTERTRDKMAASRRKGKWMGGIPALGYDVAAEGGRLVVNQAEAALVREIFALYGERQSVLAVVEELNGRGRTTKQWTSRRGREHGGLPFSQSAVAGILHNRTYTGQVQYGGETYAGEHPAILDAGVWEQAQRLPDDGRGIERRVNRSAESPLHGLLYCADCQVRMVATYASKAGRRYRYYVCARAQQRGWQSCPTKSVSATQIEAAVWERVRAVVGCDDRGAQERQGEVVERVTYDRAHHAARVWLRKECGGGEVEIPLLRVGQQAPRGRVPRMARLMALAIRCQELLRTGVVKDYAELARLGIVSRARMSQVMGLLNLAPSIQEEILFLAESRGREPVSERALRRLPSMMDWKAQREVWEQWLDRGRGPNVPKATVAKVAVASEKPPARRSTR